MERRFYSNERVFSTTATFDDGRMIEQSFLAKDLSEAIKLMRLYYPDAKIVDGEFVMTLGNYVRGMVSI